MKMHPRKAICAALALLPVAVPAADYPATVLSLNPAAYYRLGETAAVPADTGANLGTAGVVGTALYIKTPAHEAAGALAGSADKAVGLNGADQRVAVPFDSSINPTGPFSAEVWVNPDLAMPDAATLKCPFSYWSQPGSGRTGWLIYQSISGWNLRMYNGINTSQIVDITGGGPPAVGAWHHLVVVYDGTNASLFVNGVSAGQQSAAAYKPNISGPFSMGARADGNFWFPGYLDEVALYTNALSPAVIQAHYQNGINPAPGQTYDSLVLGQKPILYYRLNEPTFGGGTPVTAVNQGSLGMGADGLYEAGAITGVPGPRFGGFGTANTAMRISPLAGDVVIPPQYINTDVFTITCWFRRSGAHQAGQALVFHRLENQQQATGLGFGYNGSPGVDQLNVHWNEGPSSWLTGLTPPDDIWCFGAAVYTPSNVTVYLDNLSNTFNTTLGAHDFSLASLYIGWDFPYPRFGGSIDEVALFDRALSSSEIQSLFSSSQMTPQFHGFSRTPADPLFVGANINMTATVAGVPPFTYQWYKNNAPLSGKTSPTLSIPNAAVGDSGNYTLVVGNSFGSSTSAVQVITVSASPPLFLSQNIFNATRAMGGWVNYSVVAGGSAPISYQWKKGAAAIPGATASALRLNNLQPADGGSYSVTLSSPYGSTNSTAGVVTVLTVTNFDYAAMYHNPMAYYRLNETSGTTAFDYAGGLNGTYAGGILNNVEGPRAPAWASFGTTNTAALFNGSNARIQLPSFNLKTNQLTIVAWINPAGPQFDQTGILNTRSATGVAGFFLNYNNNDALSYVWEGTSSWSEFQSGLVPAVGQWNFVALVIDPKQGTIYLDSGSGLQSASYNPAQGNKTVVWDSPNIGVDLGYNRWFNGAIDEVAVYDRALSWAEIANLSLLGKQWPGPAPQLLAQPSSTTVFEGDSTEFRVEALGALPLAYQWRHEGTNIPTGTQAALAIENIEFADAGAYNVRVTNPVGASNSQTATLTVLPQPTFANLTNELVLHLKFDGDYLDSSIRGNNAAPVGSPAFIPGKLGLAMHYNTDNTDPANIIYNYATLGSPPDLMFGSSQNFSVSYWIRFTGTSVDLPVFSNNTCGEGCPGFYFGPSWNGYVNGSWAWSFVDISSYDVYGPPNTINDGQWHNVVSTFDRSGMATTYLDGQMVHFRAIDAFNSTIDTVYPVNVGQVGSADYNVQFGADVDDIGVWLRALTPTEAQSIFVVAQRGVSFDTYGPVTLQLRRNGADLELIWQAGTLQSSQTVQGGYTNVPGANAPYYRVTPGAAPAFYRVKL